MFKKILRKIEGEELLKGSLILFLAINVFNFLNYFFHFFMARFLGPADYGVLAVLMSIAYIFSVPTEGIQTIISRYTSKFNVKKDFGKIKYLLVNGLKKSFWVSVVAFIIYIPICFLISYSIKIKVDLLILTGFLIFGVFLIPITRGILQGEKKFKLLGVNMVIESVFKILIAVLLVMLGFAVYGAMTGIIFGIFISFLASFLFIKETINSKVEEAKNLEIYSYGFSVMLVIFTVFLMANIDIIFAKGFFNAEMAGKYAVASLLGKIILFGTLGISKAMFPLTSEGFERKKKTKDLFKKSFILVAGLSFLVLLAYLLFPKLIISILFGGSYSEGAGVLFIVSLALAFLSLSNLSLLYSLSLNKKGTIFFLIFVFIEIVSFILFHRTLMEFSLAFLIVNFIMFITSLIFTLRD